MVEQTEEAITTMGLRSPGEDYDRVRMLTKRAHDCPASRRSAKFVVKSVRRIDVDGTRSDRGAKSDFKLRTPSQFKKIVQFMAFYRGWFIVHGKVCQGGFYTEYDQTAKEVSALLKRGQFVRMDVRRYGVYPSLDEDVLDQPQWLQYAIGVVSGDPEILAADTCGTSSPAASAHPIHEDDWMTILMRKSAVPQPGWRLPDVRIVKATCSNRAVRLPKMEPERVRNRQFFIAALGGTGLYLPGPSVCYECRGVEHPDFKVMVYAHGVDHAQVAARAQAVLEPVDGSAATRSVACAVDVRMVYPRDALGKFHIHHVIGAVTLGT